jgi:hypothetical protein
MLFLFWLMLQDETVSPYNVNVRRQHLDVLRHMYLPELCSLLHRLYFDQGRYAEVCLSVTMPILIASVFKLPI